MPGRADCPRFEPSTLPEWRAWLAANHARSGSVWLVAHKKASASFAFSFDQAVEERANQWRKPAG
ncbi:MAG: hypothetical protein ACRCTI_06735 [Beijerinckiaceae bacterium]